MTGAIIIPPAGSIYEVAGEQAGYLREAAERIRGRHSRVTTEMIEIGTELSAVKENTEHGLFLGWLEYEVGMEPRLAQKYMRAAEWAETNTKLVSHLQPTAVMELAAKSTPPTVIDTVTQRIEAGDNISPTVVRQLLSQARDERRRMAEEERQSPRAKKAAAERKRKEREERERRTAEREEEDRKASESADDTRIMLAAILAKYLPDDALTAVLASLQTPWGERDLKIWDKSYSSGVYISPMVAAIETARNSLLTREADNDVDGFVPPPHIRKIEAITAA